MEAHDISIRAAVIDDAELIAVAICMAIGYDRTHPLYPVFLELAAREKAQYSYHNTLIAEVDGVAAGAIVGYDGRNSKSCVSRFSSFWSDISTHHRRSKTRPRRASSISIRWVCYPAFVGWAWGADYSRRCATRPLRRGTSVWVCWSISIIRAPSNSTPRSDSAALARRCSSATECGICSVRDSDQTKNNKADAHYECRLYYV